MSNDPTYSQRKAWNNDGMCPDWRPSDNQKDFWAAPFYRVPILNKVEIIGKPENYSTTTAQYYKTYKKMQNTISSVLNDYDPLKAYLNGVRDTISKYDIYQGRINIVGFTYKSIIIEAYVCLEDEQ